MVPAHDCELIPNETRPSGELSPANLFGRLRATPTHGSMARVATRTKILFLLLLLLLLSGCSAEPADGMVCGPGTEAVGNQCLPARAGDGGGASSEETCSSPTSYYADNDGDGFGEDGLGTACSPEDETWTDVAGDCDDDNDEVFPGAVAFHSTPYLTGDGTESFDYNCDGLEEADPAFVPFTGACGGRYPDCSRDEGYVPTERPVGGGRNPHCGSIEFRTCGAVFKNGVSKCTTFSDSAPPTECR